MIHFHSVLALHVLLAAAALPVIARADFISDTESVLKRYERCEGSSKKSFLEFKSMFNSVKLAEEAGRRHPAIEVTSDGPYTMALRNKFTRMECYLTIHDDCLSAGCVK